MSDVPLRVLHVTKGLDAGGTEQLLVLAARFRDRARVDLEVAYLVPTMDALVPRLHDEGVATPCLRGQPWFDPRWVGRLRRLLRDEPVDVVHAHAPLVASGARLAVRSLPRADRPAMVTTLHNVWSSHHVAVRALDRATERLDDLRITVSDGVRASMPGRTGERTRTLVHGVDVAALRGAADRRAARERLGIADDEVLVGTVANLRSNKAYPDLLAAAAEVVGAAPNVQFVAVGQGPLQPELEARRDELGLGDRFRFLGYRPDATDLIAGFDLFALASTFEGLPLAVMEALVLGVPVVATRVGGLAELITSGVEGELVPAGQPPRLAAALIDLAEDSDRRRARAEAAWARGTDLDAARAQAQVEDWYRELLRR